eukprot:1538020-Pyramimonas_sp.AAC.1
MVTTRRTTTKTTATTRATTTTTTTGWHGDTFIDSSVSSGDKAIERSEPFAAKYLIAAFLQH